jgi:predicted nucleic acid-binding protein
VIYLVDTNVLLRLADRTHPLHLSIRAAMRKLRHDGHRLHITPQNCVEFWNVATRPSNRNGFGLSPNSTHQLLRLIERLFPLLPDMPTIYTEWRRLVLAFNVSGVQVHDARLVAAMKAHSVTCILTLNTTDFVRYESEGIVAVDPTRI